MPIGPPPASRPIQSPELQVRSPVVPQQAWPLPPQAVQVPGMKARALFATRGFLGEIGAAVASVGKVGIPARGRAEHELDLSRVAGGNRATDHLATNRNGLAAHGAHERGTACHGPLFTTDSRA